MPATFAKMPARATGPLAERVDDFPIGCFGKRLQRARPNASLHSKLQAEACRHGVIRSFEDRHHVVVAHGEIEGFELAAHFLESFLGGVETTRRVLRLQDALLGPVCKHDVCGHSRPPSGSRASVPIESEPKLSDSCSDVLFTRTCIHPDQVRAGLLLELRAIPVTASVY